MIIQSPLGSEDCPASNHWQEYFCRFVPPGAINDRCDSE
jgi:hypothetical protein